MPKWSKWLEEDDVEPQHFEKISQNKDKPIQDRTNHKKKVSRYVGNPNKNFPDKD